jgi:hypothetical protein
MKQEMSNMAVYTLVGAEPTAREEEPIYSLNKILMDLRETTDKEYTIWFHIKDCCRRLPTLDDAYHWSHFRLNGGPMTEEDYIRYRKALGATDDKELDAINRLRSRTTFGWYIASWFRFFRSFTPTGYKACRESHVADAVDMYLESMRRDDDFYNGSYSEYDDAFEDYEDGNIW